MYSVLICIFAGMGAGFATGFSGISAALVISPMLVSFLGFDAYEAITIALLSDVLAAADSTINYTRAGHLKIKDSLILLASVLLFTLAGSWVSRFIPRPALGSVSVLWALVMGLKFLLFPKGALKRETLSGGNKRQLWESAAFGAAIGFISGFAGAGGGMMTLFVLTTFLGYPIKDAVGTSVFIMTFTALFGGLSHVAIGGVPQLSALYLCTVSTLLSAMICSRLANKVSGSRQNRITGIFLTALGVAMAISYFIF